jgi:hypothetical protein
MRYNLGVFLRDYRSKVGKKVGKEPLMGVA